MPHAALKKLTSPNQFLIACLDDEMLQLFELTFPMICAASGLTLSIGMMPHLKNIRSQFFAFAGLALGAFVGVAFNLNKGPLLM